MGRLPEVVLGLGNEEGIIQLKSLHIKTAIDGCHAILTVTRSKAVHLPLTHMGVHYLCHDTERKIS